MTTVRHRPDVTPPVRADAPTCEECTTPLEARTHAGGRRQRYCGDTCRKRAQRRSERPNTSPVPVSDPGHPGRSLEGGAGRFLPGDRVAVPAKSQPDTDQSWYHAKFASPGEESAGQGRRALRYRLRALLRQVSSVERCKRCGKDIVGGAAVIKVRAGVAHFANIESCGRVWLCAVCSAKIRARRGDEIAEAVGRHITGGGGAYFATATLPHEHGDALGDSLDVLTKSWRALQSTKAAMDEKERFGVLGNIKAVEITHGRNGWHPHIHAVILTVGDVGVLDLCDWFGRLDARWARALVRNGWAPGKLGYRFRLDLVNRSTAAGLAAYVTKVQDVGLGNEIARADLKRGRKSSRTPLQILADFGTDGLAADADLWLEYEKATAGKSALRWSRGLRAQLLPDVDEQTDEEIAAEDIGGDEVAVLLPYLWYRLTEIPGADAAILDAIESDGMEGLIRTLVAYRLGVDGVLTPDEWASQ